MTIPALFRRANLRAGWRSGLPAAAQVLVCAAAVTLIDSVVADFFGSPEATVMLAGTAIAGVLSAVALVPRYPVAVAAALSAVVFVVMTAVVLHGPPTPSAIGGVIADIWRGWDRMLSVNLPADPLPPLLTLPLMLSWTAAFAAVAASIRSENALAPAVPIVVGLVVGLLLVASSQERHMQATAGVTACVGVLIWLRVRSSSDARRRGAIAVIPVDRRRGASALSATVSLSVIAGLVGVAALGSIAVEGVLPARFDIRTVDPPPVAVRPTVTPLTLVTAQLRRPARPLLRVRLEAGAPVDQIRTAVLDRYDGATWTSSAQFRVAGRVLPTTAALDGGHAVVMSVLLEDWSGPFLPVLGTPVAIGGSDVSGEQAGYDTRTATLVWTGPTRKGATYTVTGLVPTVDDGLRSAQLAPLGVEDAPPPDVPVALRDVAERTLGRVGTPLDRLRRLETFLRGRPYSVVASSGHTFAALAQLTTATAPNDAGGAEQHAAAFALLARIAGFPARVAVGYRLEPPGPDNVRTVTSHEAYAWPEIHFARYGWVAFDPTDMTLRAPDPQPAPKESIGPPPLPTPPQALPPDDVPASGTDVRTHSRAPVSAWIALLLGVVATAAGIPAAKSLRRYRRRRGDPAKRVRGAWEAALDVLADRPSARGTDRRLVLSPAQTPNETAAAAETVFGPAARPLARLATTVTRATYSDDSATELEADIAWRLVDQLRRDLDSGPGEMRRRLRAAFDPRSLARPAWCGLLARRSLRQLGLEKS